jgi:hypothetical protein
MQYEDITFRVVPDRELSAVITEKWGREFSVSVDLDCTDDHWHYVDARDVRLTRFDREDLAAFKSGRNIGHMTTSIVRALVAEGILEPMRYMIHVRY